MNRTFTTEKQRAIHKSLTFSGIKIFFSLLTRDNINYKNCMTTCKNLLNKSNNINFTVYKIE